MEHFLKCWPEYFKALEDGEKKFELRKDDRMWEVGDKITLMEWNPTEEKNTGRRIKFTITYILRNAPQFGLMDGYCILSLEAKK